MEIDVKKAPVSELMQLLRDTNLPVTTREYIAEELELRDHDIPHFSASLRLPYFDYRNFLERPAKT